MAAAAAGAGLAAAADAAAPHGAAGAWRVPARQGGRQGKLPMALGPWPLWDTDEEQPETESADAEVEVGDHAETAPE